MRRERRTSNERRATEKGMGRDEMLGGVWAMGEMGLRNCLALEILISSMALMITTSISIHQFLLFLYIFK